jgi:hypothetical protein
MQESVKFVDELNSSPVLKALASYFGRANDSQNMPGPRSLPANNDTNLLALLS